MQKEAVGARLRRTEPLATATKLHRRCVVKHEDAFVRASSQNRLPHVGRVHRIEADLIVV